MFACKEGGKPYVVAYNRSGKCYIVTPSEYIVPLKKTIRPLIEDGVRDKADHMISETLAECIHCLLDMNIMPKYTFEVSPDYEIINKRTIWSDEELLFEILSENPSYVMYTNPNLDMSILVCEKDIRMLKYIPQRFVYDVLHFIYKSTSFESLFIQALKDGLDPVHIEAKYYTQQLLCVGFELGSLSWKDIPEEYKNRDMMMKFVKTNPSIIFEYKGPLDVEVFREAVLADKVPDNLLEAFTEDVIINFNESDFYTAVRRNGNNIKFIPKHHITPDLSYTAMVLSDVPLTL